MDCYYDAFRAGYYYNRGGAWTYSAYAPAAYRGYDVRRFHHVVVNYYGNRPYEYFRTARYGYVQRYHRAPVREYRRVEYIQPRGHWNHGYDRGYGRGHEDGRGRWHDNGRGHGRHEG